MLTSDLVRARLYKGAVRPSVVDEDDEESLALAGQLIDTFVAHQGRPRHALDGELKELLGTGTQFILHRGLAKLLYDRCELDVEAPIEPEVLRRDLFDAAAAAYRRADQVAPEETDAADEDSEATTEEPENGEVGHPFRFDRAAVLVDVAASHDLTVEEVEGSLYADLKDEQVLQKFRPVKPRWLLGRYNVALAQGVLLRASELEIHLVEPKVAKQRALFRAIKFFRLLHRVSPDGEGGWKIKLDGPMSLFKASGKYGVQMASFLPTLLHFDHWTLEAKVRWGKARRPARFELASTDGLRPYGPLRGQWQPEELQWLPEQLAKITDEWTVSTDAEVIPLGGQGVLVPDYVFEHEASGRQVVMEVLGFWRKGAVKSRLALLRKHGPENLILAVSKQLVADEESLEKVPGEVYVFRAAPVARKVLKLLDQRA